MDQIIASIQALSAPVDHPQLQLALKSAEATLAAAANQGALTQALALLEPGQHSLGALYMLVALAKSNQLPPQSPAAAEFVDYTTNFLKVCDRTQIALAPDLFCLVSRKFKELVVQSGNPRRGVRPLECALRALQPSSEVLTPIHADFFQLCLLSKCYNAAAEVLEEDIFDVDPQRTTCTPTDLFLYCYYGGMLLLGRKDYGRAIEFLLTALTAPALVGNAIVLAAYKKYVLASLVHAGHVTPLPKFTSAKVRQVVEGEAKPYDQLAAAYASHNAERLRKALDSGAQAFAADSNTGLVRLVASSLVKRSIQRLTQTYLALALQDIASQVGLGSAEEAEMHLLRMVADGEIHAVISGTMVTFTEDGEQYNSAAMVERLDGCMRRCMRLNERLHRAHDMVSTDRAYVSKVFSAKDRGASSSRYDAGGGAGSGLEDFGSQGLYQP